MTESTEPKDNSFKIRKDVDLNTDLGDLDLQEEPPKKKKFCNICLTRDAQENGYCYLCDPSGPFL